MTRSRAIVGGFLMGMLAFAGLAAVLLLALGRASAAPPGNGTSPPATNGSTPPAAQEPSTSAAPESGTFAAPEPGLFAAGGISAFGAAGPTLFTADGSTVFTSSGTTVFATSGPVQVLSDADAQHYADLLTQNMAAQLGVDQARLNAAFTAAANATIDQAVKDGKVPQEQADQAKAQAAKGLSALIINGFSTPGMMGQLKMMDDGGATGAALQAAQTAIAQRLGLTTDQIQSAIQGGQTLEAIAQAHNVTVQQVKDAALAAAQAALTAGVQSGQWTQAQADGAYQMLSQNADDFLLKMAGTVSIRVDADDAQTTAVFQAAWTAVTQLLGLPPSQFKDALKHGQPLQALEQAHNVTAQQVRDAALAAARSALTAGVQSGQWTQAQAAETTPVLPRLVDDFLTSLSVPRVPVDNGATK